MQHFDVSLIKTDFKSTIDFIIAGIENSEGKRLMNLQDESVRKIGPATSEQDSDTDVD